MMTVLVALPGAGASGKAVYSIFDRYPIGEKHMEKGSCKTKWLQKQIDKEKKFVSQAENTSSSKVLEALAASEKGDADLLMEICRNRYCHDHAAKQTYRWTNNFWVHDTLDTLLTEVDRVVDLYKKALSEEKAKRFKAGTGEASSSLKLQADLGKRIERLQTVGRRKNIIQLACAGNGSLGITGGEWDRTPLLLGCQNGVVHLERITKEVEKSGKIKTVSDVEFRDARPDDYIKAIVPTPFLGLKEKAPRFIAFLNEIFDEDDELIEYMQRLIGYSILGNSSEHLFVILYGRGRNGKGTLIQVLSHVLGSIVGNIPPETLLATTYQTSGAAPRPDLLQFQGKRIVWASETGAKKMFDVEAVKSLTGGDKLTARQVFGKGMVTFEPTHTLFLLTNHKPMVATNEYAYWKRVHLVPFNVSFVDYPIRTYERKYAPKLCDELYEESSGILAWIIKGCLQYQEIGLSTPESILAERKTYEREGDVITLFLNECCETGDGLKSKGGKLHKAFGDWCKEREIIDVGPVKFGKELKKRFKSKLSGGVTYLGVALK